ncbi:uncharacterized protein LOC113927838 [Zalophus californianus]|uniref:Uncharacterized protein LOC113927838 n=1 Tax=Zalophus californianus TaxID=9704 RepID=A0A6J2DVP9_ZALCA|nr:uncharacterized protein LOC113927838 [Zalophus californianus]
MTADSPHPTTDTQTALIAGPESLAKLATGAGDPRSTGRVNTHLWLPTILGKPPTARRRGTAVRCSGRLGSRALPSPNHSAPCSRPQDGGGQPSPALSAASARQEFEGKPVRVTSGAGGGLGDSSARGATPRERGRRAACARRAPGTGRGAGRGWLGRACAVRTASWRRSRRRIGMQITMSPPEKMEAIRLKFPQLAPCGRDYHLATKYSFSLLSNRTKLDGIGPSRMQTTFPDSHAGENREQMDRNKKPAADVSHL